MRVGARLGIVRADSAAAEVWHAWLPDHAGMVQLYSADLLSDGERKRLLTYKSADAANRFVVTRALVRSVLAAKLRLDARAIPITVTDVGKPIVAGGSHFNVSHSGDIVVLAVSDQRAVGIDVERKREVPRADALIARWLTAGEQAEVARREAAGVGRSDAFLAVWSLKEARLKALGVGIAGAPGSKADSLPALPLDDLLAGLRHGSAHYVGAVAFA